MSTSIGFCRYISMYADKNRYSSVNIDVCRQESVFASYIDVCRQESVFASIYRCMQTIIEICQYISMYVDKNRYLPVISMFVDKNRYLPVYINVCQQ